MHPMYGQIDSAYAAAVKDCKKAHVHYVRTGNKLRWDADIGLMCVRSLLLTSASIAAVACGQAIRLSHSVSIENSVAKRNHMYSSSSYPSLQTNLRLLKT